MTLARLEIAEWRDYPVRYGFFTRCGGVSAGAYASLNAGYGSGDDLIAVRENRARVAAALDVPLSHLLTLRQIHSAQAVIISEQFTPDAALEADAMVTDRPGLALGILHADCAPILLLDPVQRVIGAAHAGWKGAKAGVIGATIDAMVTLGAKTTQIQAAIGPAIGPASYEVNENFKAGFISDDLRNEQFFSPGRPAHCYFDLPGYCAHRLVAAGITVIHSLARDTFAEPEVFFSYRRNSLKGEPQYGRLISAITLSS